MENDWLEEEIDLANHQLISMINNSVQVHQVPVKGISKGRIIKLV